MGLPDSNIGVQPAYWTLEITAKYTTQCRPSHLLARDKLGNVVFFMNMQHVRNSGYRNVRRVTSMLDFGTNTYATRPMVALSRCQCEGGGVEVACPYEMLSLSDRLLRCLSGGCRPRRCLFSLYLLWYYTACSNV